MDKLLALIAEIGHDDEEDIFVRFSKALWLGRGIEVQIEISAISLGRKPRKIHIRCQEVLAYVLNGTPASSLEVTSDHPVLWSFKSDHALAFFYGVPTDTNAAIYAMYRAHRNAVADWLDFESHINTGIDLFELLKGGHGLLACGPIPLLKIYKDALISYGVEVKIQNSYPPGGLKANPEHQNKLRNDSKAVLIGSSYIAGMGWTTE